MRKILPLSEIPYAQFVACYNEAFSDYFIKFEVDEAYLRWKSNGARVNYDLSAAVLEDDKMVAFVVTGVDDWQGLKTAYNGGTGVIPSQRGNRLTSEIYDFLMPKFKAADIEQCTLEVIMKNFKAVKVYEHLGFKIERGFNCFSGEMNVEPKPLANGLDIRETTLDKDLFQSFWDYQPSWESTFAAIERNLDSFIIKGIFDGEACVGYVIYRPQMGYIVQMGVHKKYRNQSLGKHLFKEVLKDSPILKINNVESNAWSMLSFLQKAGLKNPINQYEMKRLI